MSDRCAVGSTSGTAPLDGVDELPSVRLGGFTEEPEFTYQSKNVVSVNGKPR